MYFRTNQNATIVAANAVNEAVVENRTVATEVNKRF